MSREYLKGEAQEARAYSRAVKIKGGTTVYLAGIGGAADAKGNSLAGNFEAQARAVFEQLRQVRADVGGGLDNITTMTVFITDNRFGDRFVEIRKEYFDKGYPCSALITVHSLARPEMLVEIQATAVLDE